MKGRVLDQLRMILGMGSILSILLLAFGATNLEAAETEVYGPAPRILSYSQWKEEQLTEANNRLVRAENQLLMASKKAPQTKELDKLHKEKEKCQQAVEITKEFTIEDYFVVYLSKLGHSTVVLREAAKVLSDDEVAELMKVFIKSHNRNLSRSGSAWVPTFRNGASNKL